MNDKSAVVAARFVGAGPEDCATGLLGFLSFTYGELRVDSVTLRRTLAGRLELSYPVRTRGGGRSFPIVCPVDDDARQSLESAVLEALYPRLVELGLAGAQ